MKSTVLRQKFLDFFAKRGHPIVPSASLIPTNDPSLLFTNAGMVPFKNLFLGLEKQNDNSPLLKLASAKKVEGGSERGTGVYMRVHEESSTKPTHKFSTGVEFQKSSNKAVSAQLCLRAGGKHNDLENVGYTARHHTLFEMLGNFSFGDYFKREAIHFAWDFLTEELKLPQEKLWITVFDKDIESEKIWLEEIGIDPTRFSRIGAKDNFWSMGDTGPCGPCSEIFYDHGEEIVGGPPGSKEEDGDRYIEIWNLVFMQYNRLADGTLEPLPKPSVDTGMGLERLSAVMQKVHNNYETDLFMPIIQVAANIANIQNLHHQSLRVIADHLRATAFLIADGIRPLNEGRGYVLRRIMRRAMRHGYKLNMPENFFVQLLPALIDVMGKAYPQLVTRHTEIAHVMKVEEEQFMRTLSQGMKLLEQAFLEKSAVSKKQLAGETVFKLYDTYGFPVDLTADIAREKNYTLDMEGFEKAMDRQRELSKSASKFDAYAGTLNLAEPTIFKGYTALNSPAKIIGIWQEGEALVKLKKGDAGVIVLNETTFYAESGGQIGDQGFLKSGGGVFRVENTQKAGQGVAHIGVMDSGEFSVGDIVNAEVNASLRQQTALNHSATHLLHSALQQILGSHVEQKGSLVASDRLRFDFTHSEPMTSKQLHQVEQLVNQQIRQNHPIHTELMSPKEAVAQGAKALFGEKYGDEVRVLSMGEFSKELCGGTHVTNTGDIGLFKIIEEASVAAGVRRIEAVTGDAALNFVQHHENILRDSAQLIKANRENFIEKLQQNLQMQKNLEKQLEQLQEKFAVQEAQALWGTHQTSGEKFLIQGIPHKDAKQLRLIAEALKNHFTDGGFLLASHLDGRVSLVAVVASSLSKTLKAGEWVNAVAQAVGGKGGGRPDFAQAGGPEVANFENALKIAKDYVNQ